MDEYTFIVLAKLKADRRKLKREALAASATPAPPERKDHRAHSHRALDAVPKFQWREQS